MTLDLDKLRDVQAQIEEWLPDGYRETPEYREGYEAGRRAARVARSSPEKEGDSR